MKAWIYYILISVIFISGVSTGIYFNHDKKPTKPTTPATPPAVGTTYTYVSLGDSIAEGYGLSATKDENGFISGSYTNSLKNKLSSKHSKFQAYNYAEAGQTSTDLLSILTNLTGSDLSAAQYQMKQNIQSANTITICIGANDILGPAQNILVPLVMGGDLTSCLNDLDTGLATFQTNFPQIVAKLKEFNPSANLVFSNIYNPYKDFLTTNHSVTISAGFLSNTMDANKFKFIGQLAEAYIDGDIVYSGATPIKTVENGINQIINTTISGMSKCSMLDVKSTFDNYFDTNSTYDIIQCNVLSVSTITVSGANMQNQLLAYIDPHPNQAGHNLINSLFTTSFIDNL